MAAVQGLTCIFKVNTGTDNSPVYTAVAGSRTVTLNLSVKDIDITSKDSANWAENMPGIRSWTIDFAGLLLEDQGTYDVLRNCMINNTQLKIQINTPANHTFTGKGTLSSIKIEGPFDQEMTISGAFNGTGALVYA